MAGRLYVDAVSADGTTCDVVRAGPLKIQMAQSLHWKIIQEEPAFGSPRSKCVPVGLGDGRNRELDALLRLHVRKERLLNGSERLAPAARNRPVTVDNRSSHYRPGQAVEETLDITAALVLDQLRHNEGRAEADAKRASACADMAREVAFFLEGEGYVVAYPDGERIPGHRLASYSEAGIVVGREQGSLKRAVCGALAPLIGKRFADGVDRLGGVNFFPGLDECYVYSLGKGCEPEMRAVGKLLRGEYGIPVRFQ
jgi:hypothetical protein